MDNVEVTMEEEETKMSNKEEQQSIQIHDDYKNPGAVAEWEDFVSKSKNSIQNSTISSLFPETYTNF